MSSIKDFLYLASALCIAGAFAGCGGGSGSSGALASPMTLAPGSSYTMPANTSVLVPSGTIISAPDGSSITIDGSNETFPTQAGAVVTVPASATVVANDIVTTVSANSGSSSSSGGSSSSSGAPTAPITLAPGSTYTMPANTSVLVPSGTTVSAPNGSSVTIDGSDNTVNTQVGAVVTVPATATGVANNVVTTVPAGSGSSSGSGGSSSSGGATTSLNVTALAGSATTNADPQDGTGTSAVFWGGGNLAMDGDGDVILSDRGALRLVSQQGVVTTLLQGSQPYFWQGISIDSAGNIYGSSGGSGYTGSGYAGSIFEAPASGQPETLFPNWEQGSSSSEGWGGLAIDGDGNLFLANAVSNQIIEFTPGGTWTVFAGSGASGNTDGSATTATFNLNAICDMPIDSAGNLYLNTGTSIRQIAPDGTVSTIVSNISSNTNALALDQQGNFYVASFQVLYRISSDGTITSFPFPNTTDFVTSMTTDKNGNLYLGTRGVGAQIFKVSF